jgi:putative transposase
VGNLKEMPKLKHYDNLGTARFITFSCYRRQPELENDRAKELFIDELINAREIFKIKIIGYVIMPEHIHLVLIPLGDLKVGAMIGQLKSLMARKYFDELGKPRDKRGVLWEKRCYDHNCRSMDFTVEKINYCHYNPVKRGLVDSPVKYYWSSYNWYQGKRDVPLNIDSLDEYFNCKID